MHTHVRDTNTTSVHEKHSTVFLLACLPRSYRFSEFRDGNAVGEGVAVAGVVHQNTRQEHGTQVVSIQNVDS